jgi:hypothetical protein
MRCDETAGDASSGRPSLLRPPRQRFHRCLQGGLLALVAAAAQVLPTMAANTCCRLRATVIWKPWDNR